MKLSITFLAIALASIGSITASPTPSPPQSGLKQLTREELVRREESKHLQRRAVPLPSNRGYPTCDNAGTGTNQFAILTKTYPAGATYLNAVTRPTIDECPATCAANSACRSSYSVQNQAGTYNCYMYSDIGTLTSTSTVYTAVRGSCADAIGGNNYNNVDANCCEQYI